jgi:hypothetical protein
MKREKKLTKKERKAIERATAPAQAHHDHAHIHCIVCGRHLDPHEFDDPATATVVTCLHKSDFPCCVGCTSKAQELLAEHDRTGEPVKTASAWH